MRAKRLLTFSVLCAVLALVGLAAAGCGDDDSGSPATSESTATSGDSTTTETETGEGSGGNAPAPSGDAVRSAKVEIKDLAHDPDPVTIEESGKGIWQNDDS